MRPSNKSRSRNKSSSHNGGQQRRVGNIVNRVFDSSGPDGKVRGTPQQIIDKYNVLARDAQVSGDRVAAESYLQHAEHYSRMLGEAQRQQQEQQEQQQQQQRQNNDREREDNQWSDQPRDEGRQRSEPPQGGSGLTMIDTQDGDDISGPVETPESRQRQEPVSTLAAAPDHDGTNGSDRTHSAGEPAAAAPPKRSRPRRKAKPETPSTNDETATAAE
jgi:hypothetical protein